LKALKGDSSDNIGGLKGIGPRTAARLLVEHGSLTALLDDPARMPAQHRDALLAQADRLRHVRALTTICREVPVSLDLAVCCVQQYDRQSAAALVRAMGLGRLAQRLPTYTEVAAPKPRKRKAVPAGQLALF